MAEYIKLPAGLVEVEQFLDYCGITYEPKELEGKRIPVMLRFRFYLEAVELEGRITAASTLEECEEAMAWCLQKAMADVGAGAQERAHGGPAAWAAGCLSTTACAACKSDCGTAG